MLEVQLFAFPTTWGNFLLFLDFSKYGLAQEELFERCKKAGVAMNNGAVFGTKGEGHMRMNIGTPRFLIEEALEKLHNEFDK